MWALGHNSPDSFGAHSWFVPRPDGGLMVDAPRHRRALADGVVVVPVPGHPRGSVVVHVDDRWLFTGDSLAGARGAPGFRATMKRSFTWP